VERARDVCDALLAQLQAFDFRNGALRRKFDAIKYTLKKLEQVVYELSLSESFGAFAAGRDVVGHDDEQADPAATAAADEGEGGVEGRAGKRARKARS
jgi:hypothetical protein